MIYNYKSLTLALLLAIVGFTGSGAAKKNLTNYVNPFLGTNDHGHTFPCAALPGGMVQLGPDTDIKGWDWCSGYHYSDNSIMGFSHLHRSGMGAGDWGDIMVMPTTENLRSNQAPKTNQVKGTDRYSRTRKRRLRQAIIPSI